MEKIRVLIADDHAVLRAGLGMLINATQDITVVGEAADGEEAVKQTKALRPNIVLLDITMPGNKGMKTLSAILETSPQTKVLILTMHEDPAYVRSALASGASGYLVKKVADAELISAIRAVHRGRIFVDSSQTSESIFTSKARGLLSEREMQVLQFLAQGFTHQQIARRIFVSVKTVETYRSRLAKKLELHTRADIVRYALEVGLLTPEQ